MKTDFKKVIETQADGLKISQVDNKEIEQVNDDGSTEKIKYKKVKFTYEHAQGGSKIRARPMFTTPALEQPRGIKLDKGKITAFTIYDESDENVNCFISDKESTQTRGWVPQENIKIVTKGGKTFAKAARGGDLYESPDESSDVKASFDKNDMMNVEDQNEDDTWYLVAAGGQDGFFSTMKNKIANLLFEDKRCGFSNSSVNQIKMKIRNPVYRPIDPETGNPVEGKSPSTFFKCSYFAARPKEKKKESYARYQVPTGAGNDPIYLDLETMKKSALKLSSAVVLLVDVYIGGGKIIPQYYITDAVVVDISEIKMPNEMEEELKRQAEDDSLVAKLRKQLAEAKKFEAPSFKDKEEVTEALNNKEDSDDADDNGESFGDLISNEPKKGSVLDDLEATMEENVTIPGLPDDE